jgi:hypothetical protein
MLEPQGYDKGSSGAILKPGKDAIVSIKDYIIHNVLARDAARKAAAHAQPPEPQET